MSKWLWSAALAAAAVGSAFAFIRAAPVGAAGDYTTLTAIHQEFQAVRRPTVAAGLRSRKSSA